MKFQNHHVWLHEEVTKERPWRNAREESNGCTCSKQAIILQSYLLNRRARFTPSPLLWIVPKPTRETRHTGRGSVLCTRVKEPNRHGLEETKLTHEISWHNVTPTHPEHFWEDNHTLYRWSVCCAFHYERTCWCLCHGRTRSNVLIIKQNQIEHYEFHRNWDRISRGKTT